MYRTSTYSAILSIRPASYVVSVRAVGVSPRTSSPTGCYLPAAVLQVWVSASSRYLVDFHHSSHIASVVQTHPPTAFAVRGLTFTEEEKSAATAAHTQSCQSQQRECSRSRLGDGHRSNLRPGQGGIPNCDIIDLHAIDFPG